MLWQIASATGWSVHHIMWKINYQTLRMMLADAPHYETSSGRKGKGTDKKGRRKKGKDAASFFQSMLKNNNKQE